MFSSSKVQQSEGSVVPRFNSPKVQQFQGSPLRRFSSFKVHHCEGSAVPRFTNLKVYPYHSCRHGMREVLDKQVIEALTFPSFRFIMLHAILSTALFEWILINGAEDFLGLGLILMIKIESVQPIWPSANLFECQGGGDYNQIKSIIFLRICTFMHDRDILKYIKHLQKNW